MGDTYILKRCPRAGHLHYPESESDGGISTAAQAICSDNAPAERTHGKVVHDLAVPCQPSSKSPASPSTPPHRYRDPMGNGLNAKP